MAAPNMLEDHLGCLAETVHGRWMISKFDWQEPLLVMSKELAKCEGQSLKISTPAQLWWPPMCTDEEEERLVTAGPTRVSPCVESLPARSGDLNKPNIRSL
ncbi:hypothetical protein GOP47_0012520 [Adiantum capillus-veneris]|uniref:Uncharacterized protein n=1 Tax=Adiantum capillus-veneris TaxID=13818 RepID=A0A9D4ZEH8_ADICA|nr:hypothetical protein GOP47_0012520 [Adiantum capillus-veneris]